MRVLALAKACVKANMEADIGTEKGAFMNIVTVAEIKRGGFAVLESALERGPVHLMKRNRTSAVLLRPADYNLLVQQARNNAEPLANAGLQLLLATEPATDGLNHAGMQARLAGLHAGWNER